MHNAHVQYLASESSTPTRTQTFLSFKGHGHEIFGLHFLWISAIWAPYPYAKMIFTHGFYFAEIFACKKLRGDTVESSWAVSLIPQSCFKIPQSQSCFLRYRRAELFFKIPQSQSCFLRYRRESELFFKIPQSQSCFLRYCRVRAIF